MEIKDVNRIFKETSYVRWGGSKEELKCANYLKNEIAKLNLDSYLEKFEVQHATIKKAKLIILEPYYKEIECKGYFNSGNINLTSSLYYLTNDDSFSLSQVKNKVILIDTNLGYWKFKDLLDNGALGIITFNGNANYNDKDIQQRELRSYFIENKKLPCFGIHVNEAIELVKNKASKVHIELEQIEDKSYSYNLISDIKGKNDKTIIFTAHYDSVDNSIGIYDNMSGCVTLLELMSLFLKNPTNYNLKFIFCGSEERGLLGSKAYVKMHKDELKDIALCINVDMIGTIMGKMIACCTSEEKLVHFVEYLGLIEGMDLKAYQGVYSSDSTPFSDNNVPAISFARMAPSSCADFHNRYDGPHVLDASRLLNDANFIFKFASFMANSKICPVKKEIPENMKEELDKYLLRKRK